MVCKTTRELYAWGSNISGRLGVLCDIDRIRWPTLVEDTSNLQHVYPGRRVGVGSTDDEITTFVFII